MNKRCIWITRSQPGAAKSANFWQSAGFETIVAPLINIAPPSVMPPLLPRNIDLIVTSQNALLSLVEFTDVRSWNIWAVGEVTAEMARNMGFNLTGVGGGSAASLLELIVEKNVSSETSFAYISGQNIRLDISQQLRKRGFQAERHIYYENSPVSQMPDIDLTKISHIGLYSPMAAQVLTSFAPKTSQISTISISKSTDAALGNLAFTQRLIAEKPQESAMLTALKA